MFKMKKRILAIGMCVIMAFSMTACGKSDKKTASSGNVKKSGTVSTAVADMKGTEYKSTVTLPDYKSITLAESLVETSDDDLHMVDYNLLSAPTVDVTNATRNEGTIKQYDVVDIDFEGKVDGVAFEGGSSKGYNLGIGSGSFIDGFEEGLIGVKVGDTVDLSLKFPDTYSNNPDLAGKDVIFTVTVNGILGVSDQFIADNTQIIQYFLYRYFSKAEAVTTVDEYYAIVKRGLEVQQIIGNTFESIRNDTQVVYDDEELQSYIEEQEAPYYQQASESEMDIAEFLQYYNFSSVEEFDQYWEEVYGNMCVMMAIARAENLEVTEKEYEAVVNAMVYISSGEYADVSAFEEDYDKQDTVDDILYGKVYYKVADYIKIVPDEEAQIKPQESTEASTDETSAAQ